MRDGRHEIHLQFREPLCAMTDDDPHRHADDQEQEQPEADRQIATMNFFDERAERPAATMPDDELPVVLWRRVTHEREPGHAHRNRRAN